MPETNFKCPFYRGICLIYKESNIGSKEWQGPTLSVRFTEVSVLYMKMQLLKVSKICIIVTIQTSVKSHDFEELYLQLVFKPGNFTNLKMFFSVVSTDFP